MNIQFGKISSAWALAALCALSGQVEASTGLWNIFFIAPNQQLIGQREAWVLRGATYPLNLDSEQSEYCLHEQPSGGNDSCPSVVGLTFNTVPPGTDPCFVLSNGGCSPQSGSIAPGSSTGIELKVLPGAPLQANVLAIKARFEARSDFASLTVKVVPDLFAPPSSLKLFRGDAATAVSLPLSRPIGLNKPIDVFVATTDAGSSLSGISAGFSPATISPNANSTTLSLAAAGNAALGTRDLAVGAMVIGATTVPTTLMHPFTVTVADAITPLFPTSIRMTRDTTRSVQIGATVDPDATLATPSFSLTGCNCSAMKAQVALNGNALQIQTSSLSPVGVLLIGVRVTAGQFTRDFSVQVSVTPV